MSQLALINKETFFIICSKKGASPAFLADAAGCNESDVKEWLEISNTRRPTFIQAKKMAEKLHIPLAGMYMRPTDVEKKLKSIKPLVDRRSVNEEFYGDVSSLNIAISDLLTARDFLITWKDELIEPVKSFDMIVEGPETAKNWALKIRDVFEIDIEKQLSFINTRQFFLYIKTRIEKWGIIVHGFSGVNLKIARGVSIFDDESMSIIGLNNNDSLAAKTFSIIHELTHLSVIPG
jgi:hypothetical protein